MAIFCSKTTPWKLSDTNSGYQAAGGVINYTSSQYPSNPATAESLINGWVDDITFTQNETVTDWIHFFANTVEFTNGIDRDIKFFLFENVGTATMTIANPCVVTFTSHGMSTGDVVSFTTSGALPTGLAVSSVKTAAGLRAYYVNVQTADTFWLYDTSANAVAGGTTGRITTTGTQSGTHTLWIAKRTNRITSTQIMGYTSTVMYGYFFPNIALSSPYAVTTTASKYRIAYAVGAGTTSSGWAVLTNGTTGTPNYTIAWVAVGSTLMTPTSGTDFLVVRGQMEIDQSWTTKAMLGTSTVSGYCGIVCPVSDTSFENGVMIKWTDSPAASYTFTLDAGFLWSQGAGFKVGSSSSPISIANRANIYTKAATVGSVTGTSLARNNNAASVYLYGEIPTVTNTTLTAEQPAYTTASYPGSNKITIGTSTWHNNDVLISLSPATSLPTGLAAGTLYMLKNKSGSTYDLYDKTGVTQVTFTGSGSGIQVIQPGVRLNDSITGSWAVGDRFAIGRQNAAANGDTPPYWIGDITADGKTISLNHPTLSTYTQTYVNTAYLVGAPVICVSNRGVRIYGDAGITVFSPGNHCYMKGITIISPTTSAAVILYFPTSDFGDASAKTEHVLEESCGYTGNVPLLANGVYIPQKGVKFSKVYATATRVAWTTNANTYKRLGKTLKSGTIKFYDCIYLHDCIFNYANSGVNLSLKWDVQRCKIHNSQYGSVRSGIGSIYTDNEYFGIGSNVNAGDTIGAINLKNCKDCVFTNDKIDLISSSSPYYSTNIGSAILDTRIIDPKFDTVVAASPTNHFAFDASVYAQNLLIENTNKNIAVDTTNQKEMTTGSRVTFLNWNSVANDDRNYFSYGEMVRTGTSLGDTTSHTGGFAMRFQSIDSANALTYSKNIPTGNIIGKDAGVGVWCKINNAAYYAGTNQMPRLEVNYDNGTIVYAEAAQIAGAWQYLYVPFTPATTYGQITVTMDTRTDATSTNAYVYFDDFSTFFPAGVTLNLGNFDLWANGEPIAPYISTTVSAADVWAAGATANNATGSMGNVVNKTKKIVTGLQ